MKGSIISQIYETGGQQWPPVFLLRNCPEIEVVGLGHLGQRFRFCYFAGESRLGINIDRGRQRIFDLKPELVSQGLVMLQVVFVKWGTRYGAEMVNRPVRAIQKHASCDLRFVCITDDDQSVFDPAIVTRSFPQFTAPFDQLKGGCRLKMSMFAPGILQDGIPALFLDLDTLIRGDVARVRDHILRFGGIHLMRSHYLQWWKVQKWVGPAIGNKYYHGNSSAVGFMPENYHWLFDQFNRTVVGDPSEDGVKTFGVDDRFISCYCRDTLRVFPTSLMVKFSGEYMSPFHAAESLKSQLPWVKARRRDQVAVTFAGDALKPDKLVSMTRGDEVRYKWLKTRWDYKEFQDYWAARIA